MSSRLSSCAPPHWSVLSPPPPPQDADWFDQYSWSLFKAMSHMLCIGGYWIIRHWAAKMYHFHSNRLRPLPSAESHWHVAHPTQYDLGRHLLCTLSRTHDQPNSVTRLIEKAVSRKGKRLTEASQANTHWCLPFPYSSNKWRSTWLTENYLVTCEFALVITLSIGIKANSSTKTPFLMNFPNDCER